MRELTFIVQGPIVKNTKHCLASIRDNFPNSMIILSTWEKSDVADLDYDTAIFNHDPGAIEISPDKFNNVNRLIVSTQSGLQKVSTPFAVKTRTDISFANNNIISHIYNLKNASLFAKQIIAPTLFFRDPRKKPLLFHISDIFHAGNTSDMRDLWKIPLAPEPETSQWLNDKSYRFNYWPSLKYRYTPEQYWITSTFWRLRI